MQEYFSVGLLTYCFRLIWNWYVEQMCSNGFKCVVDVLNMFAVFYVNFFPFITFDSVPYLHSSLLQNIETC